MELRRIVEYAFFFVLLVLSGYMVWQLVAPFVSALALSAIIVTICYPLYDMIRIRVYKQNPSLAAFLTTLFVLLAVILPIILVSSLLVREAVSFYQSLQTADSLSVFSVATNLETQIQRFIPEFNIDFQTQLKSGVNWFAGNLGTIFAGTISTIFAFFIALIGSFYFFRDGRELLDLLVKASPLPEKEDRLILNRLAKSVRAVATGTVLVAMIQGSLVAIGFTLFGIERGILWGSLAALGALIPGVGTTIVTAPAILYLFYIGQYFSGAGLLLWSMTLVGMIDNVIGPYLMSRGNHMHPFIVLIAVLGGISLFGPIGFIIGPVMVTFFLVLLEVYNQYIVQNSRLESLMTDE